MDGAWTQAIVAHINNPVANLLWTYRCQKRELIAPQKVEKLFDIALVSGNGMWRTPFFVCQILQKRVCMMHVQKCLTCLLFLTNVRKKKEKSKTLFLKIMWRTILLRVVAAECRSLSFFALC